MTRLSVDEQAGFNRLDVLLRVQSGQLRVAEAFALLWLCAVVKLPPIKQTLAERAS